MSEYKKAELFNPESKFSYIVVETTEGKISSSTMHESKEEAFSTVTDKGRVYEKIEGLYWRQLERPYGRS